MAKSEFENFTAAIMQSSETQRLPDEVAYSYPIPLKDHRVAVYAYRLLGMPPETPSVSFPQYFLEASFPSGKVLQRRALEEPPVGIPSPDGRTLGPVQLPSEYQHISTEEFNRREIKFQQLYFRVLVAYLEGSRINSKGAKQILAQLPIFGKAALVPLFRATNPDFFSWLKSSAERGNRSE